MDYAPLVFLGAGIFRSLFGWIENSLADGKIEDFEWRLLGETLVRVSVLGTIAYFFPGLDVTPFEAAAVALGGDFFLKAVKTAKKTK